MRKLRVKQRETGSCTSEGTHRFHHFTCRSSLESRARALNFLYPPLLTSAVSGAMQSPYVGPCALSSPGKVTVRDTLIEGGSEAVTCLGSGAVSSVRCVYSALSPPLFWFVVASASARQARPRRITKRRWCPESEPGEAQAGGALAVGNAVVREGEWAGERVGRSGRGRREGENTERAGAAEKGRESEWEAWVSALSGPSAGARNPGGRGDLVCARCSDLQGLQGAPDAGPKEGEGTRGGRPSSGGSQSQGGEAAADAGGGRSMLDLIEEEMAARNRPRSLCCYCGHEILS